MARRIAWVLGALVIIGAGVLWWLLQPRDTTEVTKEDALEQFRESDNSPSSTAPNEAEGSDDDRPVAAPVPGVYTYAASGSEDVKIGPLPTEARQLPATVTATVNAAGDTCFDWNLNLFEQHTEETRWCRDGSSLRLDQHVKHQQVGAVAPTMTMTCDPAVYIGDLDAAGTTNVNCVLNVKGGPFSVEAQLSGEVTWSEPETRTIDGAEVEARRLTAHYPATGSVTGTWDETVWFDENLLPLEVERSLHLAGAATFDETSTLTLQSRTPDT